MLLDDGDIGLEANQTPLLQPHNVIDAWGCIVQNSVESLAADLPDVFSFADNHCLYFFTIRHVVEVDDEGERKNNVLSMVSIEWDANHDVETIGLVYLATSHIPNSLNIGISLLPEARTRGFARRAIWLVLNWAFTELQCHRIQAQVVDGDPKQRDTSLGLFTGLGFSHEGTLRRAAFYPTQPVQEYPLSASGEWRDIINLSILDTDWVLRSATLRIPRQLVKSRWDELFARHEAERDAMLRLEEWEEDRRTAAVQLAAAAVPEHIVSYNTGSLRESKAQWQTSSQPASSLPDYSQQLPQQQPPVSDSSDEAATDKKARKRAKKSRARAMKPAALEDRVVHSLPPIPTPVERNETITIDGIDDMPTPADDGRASTPTPMQNAPSPIHHRTGSFYRISHIDGDDGAAQRRSSSGDEEWETASDDTVSTKSSSNVHTVSDIGSFSDFDVESPPRSPSAASISSRLSASTADSWDLLETISNGSYDVAGASDMEG